MLRDAGPTSEGLKYLGLMRTTAWPLCSPSETTPTSVTPGGPSQWMGIPARANASSANFLHAHTPHQHRFMQHRSDA